MLNAPNMNPNMSPQSAYWKRFAVGTPDGRVWDAEI
jgi:hypothetical protein